MFSKKKAAAMAYADAVCMSSGVYADASWAYRSRKPTKLSADAQGSLRRE